MDEKEAVAMAKAKFSVSVAVIAPKPFCGEGDAQSWIQFV